MLKGEACHVIKKNQRIKCFQIAMSFFIAKSSIIDLLNVADGIRTPPSSFDLHLAG